LVLPKLNVYGLCAGGLKLYCNFLTTRISQVVSSGDFSSPYGVLFVVSQGSVLRPLHFNIFVNELFNVLEYLKLPSFINFYKLLHEIKFLHDTRKFWTLHLIPI